MNAVVLTAGERGRCEPGGCLVEYGHPVIQPPNPEEPS
jgi:hypothetical protein